MLLVYLHLLDRRATFCPPAGKDLRISTSPLHWEACEKDNLPCFLEGLQGFWCYASNAVPCFFLLYSRARVLNHLSFICVLLPRSLLLPDFEAILRNSWRRCAANLSCEANLLCSSFLVGQLDGNWFSVWFILIIRSQMAVSASSPVWMLYCCHHYGEH